ncbi:MAG: ribulose-phosphate 3-epimerase [Alphaproteobacteria bacterium]|nr:ribulose-phosphate 3-epimerase [Alphaproteobacteria bacterium]
MNLFDSSFLCLDIGTHGVRGIAHRVHNAHIERSAFFTVDSCDTVSAIKSVIGELEKQLGVLFDSAYITGNFGPNYFDILAKNTVWGGEHKITSTDIRNQISQITPPDGFIPIHIIPMRYDTPTARNMLSPIGHIDRQLISAFGAIFYSNASLDKIYEHMRGAHIQPNAFFDPQFVQNSIYRQSKQTTMFIDFGAEFTSASIWTDRGPVLHTKIPLGGTNISNAIAEKFNLSPESSDIIKHSVASLISKEMDRFTPADTSYDFSRSDVNEVILPILVDIIRQIKDKCLPAFTKYKPTRIVLTGGGSEIEGLRDFIENAFATPTETMPIDATVRALSEYIWRIEEPHRNNYIARHNRWQKRANLFTRLFHRKQKKKNQFIPILPSTLCFDMRKTDTYNLFASGGISMIHVDIMDGFYVDRIAGGIEELRTIRAHTNAHLHVHLMTESPTVWAADAIAAGADTIILSTNTSGLRAAVRTVRASGRRVGIALHPDSSVSLLKPILREIDEVMIMSVMPGAAGQSFDPGALHKISILAATRKKYGLKYTISVDGGINDKTAQPCWDAGANMLVSGSYLARAHDFPLAVQSLLKKSHE